MVEKFGNINSVQILSSIPSQKSADVQKNNQSINQPKDKQNQSEVQMDEKTKEKLENVIHSLNEFVGASTSHLKFEFHEKLQEYYVTIVDDKTKEIVREIPAKKMLDVYAAMTEFLGLMVDKKI